MISVSKVSIRPDEPRIPPRQPEKLVPFSSSQLSVVASHSRTAGGWVGAKCNQEVSRCKKVIKNTLQCCWMPQYLSSLHQLLQMPLRSIAYPIEMTQNPVLGQRGAGDARFFWGIHLVKLPENSLRPTWESFSPTCGVIFDNLPSSAYWTIISINW